MVVLLHGFMEFQATGGMDKLIRVWDAGELQLLHTFKGHRDAVTVSDIYSIV